MTVVDLAAPPAHPWVGHRPQSVVLRRATRAAARSGVLWGYVFGAFVASAAWSYGTIYTTQSERDALAAAFGNNKATIALFGPAPALQTVGGFTVFKVSMTLMVIGSTWGILTSTRLLRGEEDAGRWDLLLTGQTTSRAATVQTLCGFGAGALCLWAVSAALIALSGLSSRVSIAAAPALYFALALVCPAVVFLAVGALTSQLAPTRRQAAGFAAVVLGASYALRMVGDGSTSLAWVTWLSPLGWVEKLAPLSSPDPWPLLPITLCTLVLVGLSVHLAAGRDVGSSALPDHAHAAARLGLLGGPLRFSLRLTGGVMLSWLAGIAVAGLLYGYVAVAAGATLKGSSLQEVFDRLGAVGGGLGAYLGVTFLITGALVAYATVGLLGAARGEEADGRLDHLLVGPVSRTRWLGGRLLLAGAFALLCGVADGLCVWVGAAAEHAGIAPSSLVAAGINASVPAWFIMGIGVLVLGLWPRGAVPVAYAVLSWSLLVDLVGGIGATNRWVLDTTVFHHISSAPAVPVDWAAAGALTGLGVMAAGIGMAAFARRDLQGA
jgi:polyether ionophore transport system permease protein